MIILILQITPRFLLIFRKRFVIIQAGMKPTPESRRQRKVLAVIALNVYSGQRKLAGITRFFNERLPREEDKWSIDVLHGNDALTDAALLRAVRSGVSGIILLAYPEETTMRAIARSGIPCVVETSGTIAESATGNSGRTGMPRKSGRSGRNGISDSRIVRIVCDSKGLAREAAANLAVRQSFASFGYVGTAEGESWSKERGAYFRDALAERGRDCSLYAPRRGGIGAWLAALPRPAAVCAANDSTARIVAEAVLARGLRIPEDVAVLGIDDDPKFCLGATPALSSVIQDFDSCGFQSAEALQRLMDGDYTGPAVLRYGAHGVAIRESTLSSSPLADFVQKALDWIDANACSYIGASDVARAMGVSRRMLDMRFRELLRTTVHAILRERRLEEVKRLLSTTKLPVGRITEMCGFASAGHLKNLFRRSAGCSMRDYRQRRPLKGLTGPPSSSSTG